MTKLLSLLFLLPALLHSQSAKYTNYNWQKTPTTYTFTPEDLIKDETVVFEKRSVEFLSLETGLKKFVLIHNLKRLNTDLAIENNNKYYVGTDSDTKIIKLKARVIKPNGEIIEVSQKDIQQSLDEEGNIKYNYFAFEGIEKGSFIEFLHYEELYPELTGSRLTIQGYYEKKHVDVEFLFPLHLEFQVHSINGLPEFQIDKEDTNHIRMFVSIDNLAGLEDEDWANYTANLQKVYFKLSKNLYQNKGNFYTYTEVSKLIHADLYAPLSKKELKLVTTYINNTTKGATTTLDKIRQLENDMKLNISILDYYFENATNIEQILTKKVCNEKGLTKLMLNCLRELKIPFELVMTSDRTKELFLEEFQGYNFLQDHLIYIPEINKYYSSEFLSKIGFPPYEYTYNKGLFVNEINLNGYSTAIGKIKYIGGTDYKESIDVINTEITFNEDLSSSSVQLMRSNTGYKAKSYQGIIDFLDDEQKIEMKEDFLKYLDADCQLEDMKFENDRTEDFGVKPFIGRAKVISTIFTEKAGEKTLLKVGLLIGPQAQMYHEKTRVQPVDSYYKRGYEREIVINLPANYEVKNLKDLNITCSPEAREKHVGFESNYELKGNQIIITVNEWYDAHYFSVEDYPIYEQTMNAAADFNKIVLVIQSK